MMDEKFWLAIAFTSFVILIMKFVWPSIRKSLDAKSRQIAETLLEAKDIRQKAIILLEETKKYQKEAEAYARKLLNDAEDEAKKLASEAQAALENEIKKRTIAAEDRIKMEEGNAVREIKNNIINSAFKKLDGELEKDLTSQQQNALLDKAIGKLAA
jgi:F-type H+-transporting ATPase subunit b